MVVSAILQHARLSKQKATSCLLSHPYQDGTFRKRELTITPCNGTLAPGQSVELLVELMSQTVKVKAYEKYVGSLEKT